ncbi:MAG: pyridoxamine 5'-phosphate oxidase family protein [Deltaproteobacteria bacterium]|jgi:nitroimidazol reductase NimA-like FMN-containing flavoprotein (pyridoxamine 5'-phosphate oxidase superfamily)|nr:pyridoxamine 5'-phosphate oxidase family protein [Deltaproteobacteria bacterium]
MRDYQLERGKILELLKTSSTGHLATVGEDGYPYVTPVHFVYQDPFIFIHGNPKGTKIENLKENPKVSFELTKELGLLQADEACETNTRFESVIVKGVARVLAERDRAEGILMDFVRKYTPQHMDKALPVEKIKMTGIIEIKIEAITGKYYS